jgi:DNA polymerase I
MITYEYVTSAERLGSIANEVVGAPTIALDLETTGFSSFDSLIRLLSLNTGKGVYVVDAFQTKTLDPLIQALRASKGVKIGQNLKFDQKFLLHKFDLELWPIFDTYRASAILYNGKFMGRGAHDLYALYSRELGIAPEAPDLGGSDWNSPHLTKDQLDYAAEDVIHLPMLREKLKPKLREAGLNKIALIEFEAILPEAAMELNGIYLDKKMWCDLADANAEKAEQLRKELIFEMPHPKKQTTLLGFEPNFNLQSPDQVVKSLQLMGLKVQVPGTEQMVSISSSNEIVLAMFKKENPTVSKLLDYRGYAQAVKTFGREYVKHISPHTGRVHTHYFPYTGAGRYASSDPNLQQVPRSLEFRSCFRAGEGKAIVGADYSQIELRIAAELARDETLMGVYIRGEDAHAQTASLVSSVSLDEVTKAQRQQAKAVNFGFIFGMGAEKFVLYAQSNYGVSLTLGEARTFRKKFFQSYGGIQRWHQRIFSDENKRSGIIRTIAGRLRYLPVTSHSEWANTGVQGTGADGLKASLPLVYRSLKKYGKSAQMVHMVHDEILTEADKDPELLALVKKDLETCMISAIQPMLPRVPVTVESGTGDSWGTAH